MAEDTTYSKKSTGAVSYFDNMSPKGVYFENPGRINTPRDIPAGGEVRPESYLNKRNSSGVARKGNGV
jgi:hypothetical protein